MGEEVAGEVAMSSRIDGKGYRLGSRNIIASTPPRSWGNGVTETSSRSRQNDVKRRVMYRAALAFWRLYLATQMVIFEYLQASKGTSQIRPPNRMEY